jgi:metal-responsive CopG/Arc/MetJ family transcriptional regulator
MADLQLVSMNLTKVQLEKIKAIAYEKGLSYSELIRRIIDEYLEEREGKNNATTT